MIQEACYQQRRSSHDLLLANARHQEKTLKASSWQALGLGEGHQKEISTQLAQVEFEALLRMQCLLETFSHRHLEEAIDECTEHSLFFVSIVQL